MECNASKVVVLVQSRFINSTDGVIVKDFMVLDEVGGGNCYHVSRTQNMVAHTLASLGLGLPDLIMGEGSIMPLNACIIAEADLAS